MQFSGAEIQPGGLSATGAGKGLDFVISLLGGSCDSQGEIFVCWGSKRSGWAEGQDLWLRKPPGKKSGVTQWTQLHRADTKRCPVLKGWLRIWHYFGHSKTSSKNSRGIFRILGLAGSVQHPNGHTVSRDISSCTVDAKGSPRFLQRQFWIHLALGCSWQEPGTASTGNIPQPWEEG